MTPAQRSGQLIMVGLQHGTAPSSLDDEISEAHIGNFFFIGGWSNGSDSVRSITTHVQAQVNQSSTRNVKFLISADQEGGKVQQLKGNGFTVLPSALQQGEGTADARTRIGAIIGRDLKAAGVNINLAPVADVVPPGTAANNAAIGKYSREYGSSPGTVASSIVDVMKGMQDQGVLATLKHFPGLGRVPNNTDFSSSGITDDQTTSTDAFLQPFATGISQQPGMVMVASAYYSKIDGANPAIFSSAVINGMLRQRLGWNGVVISDDLNAVAVRGVPANQRGIRMIRAGGDIALTGSVSGARNMAAAMTSLAGKDPSFDQQVRASVTRVLQLKTRMGLTPCSVA
ncbi:glycoside hydrolase family 3 N-terminal domain-containing protein [Calidifontibacter terrae]